MKRNKKTLLIVLIVAVILATVTAILLLLPSNEENENENSASITLSLDDENVHQAKVKTDSDGVIEKNGEGNLLSYSTDDVLKINVKNESGKFDIEGTITEGEDGEKTVENHTLKGCEDFSMQSDSISGIITDASALSFTKIACIDETKDADFGFESAIAIVTVTYIDETQAVIYVGDEAPQGAGTYVKFGDGEAIYLVSSDAVDTFLYSDINFISLEITEAGDDEETPESIEISGTNFAKNVNLQKNTNQNNSSAYVLSGGEYASESKTDSIIVAIKGLSADGVKAINPDEDVIAESGLSNPYARLKAVYKDGTIELITSAPDSDGSLNLMEADGKVIYYMSAGNLPWATTSYDSLISEYVLHPVNEKISGLSIDNGKAYDFAVSVQEVSADDGEDDSESESVQMNATYQTNGLDSNKFTTFLENFTQLKLKSVSSDKASGEVLLTVKYTYDDSKSDVVKFFSAGNGLCLAQVNGKTSGYVYKSEVTKLSSQVESLINGENIENLNE